MSRWYFGGLASCGAACCTHPLDLLKVRRCGLRMGAGSECVCVPRGPGTPDPVAGGALARRPCGVRGAGGTREGEAEAHLAPQVPAAPPPRLRTPSPTGMRPGLARRRPWFSARWVAGGHSCPASRAVAWRAWAWGPASRASRPCLGEGPGLETVGQSPRSPKLYLGAGLLALWTPAQSSPGRGEGGGASRSP